MTSLAAVGMLVFEVCQEAEQVAYGPQLLLPCVIFIVEVLIYLQKLSHTLKQGFVEIVASLISISNLELKCCI